MRPVFQRSFVLLVASFCLQAFGQQYWSQFPNSPSGTTRHDDIYFLDATNGWATKNNLIYKTTDGGSNWTQVLSKTGTHFRCIGFATTNRGWAGNLGTNSYDSSVKDTNVLYETSDGGANWTVVSQVNRQVLQGLCAIYVLDSMHIYAGGRVRGPAYFYKTEDRGTNWSVVNLTTNNVMNGIMDIYFKDPMNGFVVGMDTGTYADSCGSVYHGRIARTRDGGATWTPVVTTDLPCCYFWKMSWPSSNVCYVSLQQNSNSYPAVIFYKSIDGGETFSSNGIPLAPLGITSFYLQGIGFATETEGWIGGNVNQIPKNILHTLDGGLTWTPSGYSGTTNMNRFRFASPLLGYSSGAKLHIYHAPLAITQHPKHTTALAGTNVSLSVAAVGETALSYQWMRNGAAISNATAATLTLSNLMRLDEGFYSVVVTNSGGSLTSSSAELHVLSPVNFSSAIQVSGALRLLFGDVGGALTSNDLSHFTVEASSNLLQWLAQTNGLILTNGKIRFDDLMSQPRQFYRVLEK